MPPQQLRTPLPGIVPAERAVLLVAGDSRPFALCGRWASSAAICGSEPLRSGDPFATLDAPPAEGAGGGVGGGWFGVLGFALGRRVEATGEPPPRPVPAPAALWSYYDHVLRLDRDGQWWFEALWTEERAEALEARRAVLAERLAAGVSSPGAVRTAPWRAVPGAEGHGAAVRACTERIAAGDLFQANLTMRLESRLAGGDAADLFAHAAGALRPDRAAFVGRPGGAVASLSPELFLERRGRAVRSEPIKGTAPAGGRDALAASAKDRAENVMIVDLVRNDLGRVCVPGSIGVPALAEPRAHTGVWHLVSEVTGTLRDDATDADLLRAAVPPGSVTGAPKVAALDVIAELESTGREAYTGAIGFASPLAGLELNVAIRTFEVEGDRIWLGAGGGVVADSDPAAEAAEAATKAAPLLEAIGARLAAPRPRPRRAPAPLRLGPRPVPRPDPAAGVFETIRAADGEAARLAEHLARLAASVAELYGAELPAEAARLVEEAAAEVGDGRVRLDARPLRRSGLLPASAAGPPSGRSGPLGGAVALSVRSAPLPGADRRGGRPAAGAPRLSPVCLPGGLGAHKWADRRLLDALAEAVAPAVPLLVDLDGLVLEASRASVFVVEGGDLVTPPLDGRILPGVGRAALAAAAREEPIGLDRLDAADGVLLVSALRGVTVVRGEQPAAVTAGA